MSTGVSTAQLQMIFPAAYQANRLTPFVGALNDAMDRFAISDNSERQAAFLAQVAHESAELTYMREIADGSAYEGRLDLGNTQPGDGPKYKGGGPIEITGRANYAAAGKALGLDLLGQPELIVQPDVGCAASAWFWSSHGLNELADAQRFGSITHRINGGFIGLDSRLHYWRAAIKALQI